MACVFLHHHLDNILIKHACNNDTDNIEKKTEEEEDEKYQEEEKREEEEEARTGNSNASTGGCWFGPPNPTLGILYSYTSPSPH